MIKLQLKNRGFTLLETMIYIALFGILMSGAVVGVQNLLEGGSRNIDSAKIQEEGTFLSRKMSWALSGAESASVTNGGSTLTIVRPDLGSQSPLVITGTGTALTISRGGGVALELNSERFPIGGVLFTYTPSVNGRPPAVSGNFVVKNKTFTFRNYLR